MFRKIKFMKSIMYHYIREKNEEYPYLNFITKKNSR